MAINFIRISPTGSVPIMLPLTHDQELENDLVQSYKTIAIDYKGIAELTKEFVAIFCWVS
jgi:hypothetical protein